MFLESCYYIVQNNKTYMKTFVNGESEVIEAYPRPFNYVPNKYDVSSGSEIEQTDLRTIDSDESVKQYFFKIPQSVKFFRTMVEKRGVRTYESDVKYNNRWMMANKVLCTNYENYATFDTEEDDSNGPPNPLFAKEPITALGITFKGQTETWAGQEKEILKDFTTFIKEQKITMLGGWNSYGWDVPFLIKRLHYNNIDFDMRSRRWLDLMWLYKFTKGKGAKSRASLEYVGKTLLGKQKPFVGSRISSLPDIEKKERVGWDSQTTWEIDRELNLSKLAITLAQKSYRFPDEVIGINLKEKKVTVTPTLDNLYLMRAKEIGYVLPNKESHGSGYRGAIVYIQKNGEFGNVLQLDFASMYPNILIGYKLAPYGKTDLVVPLVQGFLDSKDKAKIEKNDIDYWAYKVLANAVYGLFASTYYRFDAKDISASITSHARDVIIAVREFINSLGFQVLYQDTDSAFIQVSSFEDRIFIQNAINKFIEDKFGLTNLKMEVDGYWSFIDFPRGNKEENKKRYYGVKSKDKKGTDINKWEVVGLENIRGDWPDFCRELEDKIMHYKANHIPKEEILKYTNGEVEKMFNGLYDNKLVLSKNLSKPVDEYGQTKIDPRTGKTRKNPIPQHVRAYKDALINGWIPPETFQYGIVNYMICKIAQPRLANLVKSGDVDYRYYLDHQINPILYRFSLVDSLKELKASAEKFEGKQMTLLEVM